MLRRLLACLALLTGLTAAGLPARAQIVSELAARVDASKTDATAPARPAAAVSAAYSKHIAERNTGQPKLLSSRSVGVVAPPVLVGIDRARE